MRWRYAERPQQRVGGPSRLALRHDPDSRLVGVVGDSAARAGGEGDLTTPSAAFWLVCGPAPAAASARPTGAASAPEAPELTDWLRQADDLPGDDFVDGGRQ